ncbi:bifunctional riboflavin kinase/FAD synthetase [Segetibacter sp. 3557_3]|nr:bifunctional riboflavin kinase/FAD synthetase [Segetibacter sp. 3557_3]
MIQVHRNLEELPMFNNAVITIGSFDGVHLGHQQILGQLRQEADRIKGETVVITFHPHPRKVVSNGREVKILTTLDEKIDLLDKLGINHLVVTPFNEAFSQQTPGEYVENFLVKKFRPHTIIIGYDHRFGKARSGDYHLLEQLGETFGYQVKEISESLLNEIIISSTKVREALTESDIDTANQRLGYEYFFSGTVVEGNKLGRTIGYPTANLEIAEEEKLIPGNGVYAVTVSINDRAAHKGMMNIGIRPTIGGTKRVIEVNIFDFNQDIYGSTVKVFVKAFIRGEVKFTGLDQLKEQLAKDKVSASALL